MKEYKGYTFKPMSFGGYMVLRNGIATDWVNTIEDGKNRVEWRLSPLSK